LDFWLDSIPSGNPGQLGFFAICRAALARNPRPVFLTRVPGVNLDPLGIHADPGGGGGWTNSPPEKNVGLNRGHWPRPPPLHRGQSFPPGSSFKKLASLLDDCPGSLWHIQVLSRVARWYLHTKNPNFGYILENAVGYKFW
jgi:hypothetical protein